VTAFVKTAPYRRSSRDARRSAAGWVIAGLSAVLLCAGCAVTTMTVTDGGNISSERYRFSVTLPDNGFERVAASDTIVTLTDRETGVSMTIRASRDRYAHMDDPPSLEYLARHLFIDVEDRVIESIMSAALAGETGDVPAAIIKLSGVVEETPLVFFACVSRYKGYVYDLVLWSPPRFEEEGLAAFEALIDGFLFLDGR